jgi:hypothetical protein
MTGRLRSSRVNDNVLEEGLRKEMVEMKDGMKVYFGRLKGVGIYLRRA